MSTMMKRLALAGIVAGSLTGMMASLDAAQALPAAPGAGQAVSDFGVTPVQYYPYGYRYARPYGYRSFYRGRAGLYRCGPYALKTHLSRRYCR